MDLNVEPRLYQEKIFANAVKENTLVVLPTGLGKTLIALMMTLHYIKKGKVLILAPTKPLAEQHLKSFIKDSSVGLDCELITGAINPEKRLYEKQVVFATPQTIRNDIITKRIDLSKFSLIVFDECHKAVGDYAYCFIANQYKGRVLGLSASPGSDSEKIKEVCLNIGFTRIESRTEDSSDVKDYLKKKKIININLELPEELKEIMKYLRRVLSTSLKEIKDEGFLQDKDINHVFKRDLLALQREAFLKVNNDPSFYKVLSLNAKALKIMHALELLQTQGIDSLKKYFEGLKNQPAKAAKELLRDHNFQRAMSIVFDTTIEHPKHKALLDLINNDDTFLVFTQYRVTAELITKLINESGGNAQLFVGQQGKNGMNQKKQLEVLQRFRNGEFNTLVSTSISEEGLDIPHIDTAIFFEPVPSALRMVQRRGRVGRAKTGNVYVLVTKGTVDEKYKWVAHYKEKRMKQAISDVNQEELVQASLKKFL